MQALKKVSFLQNPMIFILTVFAVLMNAQNSTPDLKVDINTHTDSPVTGNWISNPLIWVIGALILILIIALVARGSGNKD